MLNIIQNGTTNSIVYTNGEVACWLPAGGSFQSFSPINYAGVMYPTVNETQCIVTVGEGGVVETLDNLASIPFGQGLYMGMVAAFAFAVAVMFFRGAKGMFQSKIGGDM